MLLYLVGFCGVIWGGLDSGLVLYSIIYLDYGFFFKTLLESYFSMEIDSYIDMDMEIFEI